MTLKNDVIQTIKERNPCEVGKMDDYMRDELGMSYNEIFLFVQAATGITRSAWDELLRKADSHDY